VSGSPKKGTGTVKVLFPFPILVGVFFAFAADNVAPTVNPPGGLTSDKCPMFISFGFDDNAYPDGVNWIADLLKSKKNPSRNGNPATYDGAVLHASFFITAGFCIDSLMAGDGTHFNENDVLNSWKRLIADGNDIGGHTYTHADELQSNHNKAVWDWENNTCITVLTTKAGVPRDQIIGFRTPFLMFTKESMQSELDHGFLYDCSIEHYKDQVTDPYNPRYVWPYTLDRGQAPSAYVRDPTFASAPGLWEMPVYEIMTDTTWQAVTGLDYNMWVSKSMNKGQFENCLKITLDNRLSHNRAPFLIGMHSDYYSQYNDAANGPGGAKETWQNRRAAVEDFITYALALNKDVRIVSHKDVLTWVRHPVALGSAVAVFRAPDIHAGNKVLAKFISGSLCITVPSAGLYQVALYDMNGRTVAGSWTKKLTLGENVLMLKRKITAGSFIVTVNGSCAILYNEK
jgi:hypothetical protein